MDTTLFRWINGWPDSLAPLFVFFSEATKHPVGKVLFFALAVALLVAGPKGRRALILAIVAVAVSNEVTDLLKAGLPELRPCIELNSVRMRTGILTSYGTASAHSANMAALATVLVLTLGWRGSFGVPIALLTGLSRIYVGVHYPSQVVLGWTCGIVVALGAVKGWEAFVRWRQRNEAVAETSVDEHSASSG